MKEVNLVTIQQAYNSLNETLFKDYLTLFGISPKEDELEDLKSYINEMKSVSPDISVYDSFYFGYTIPQISKEFDLLRIGSDTVVDIELKSSNTGAKIYNQIIRNQYYLSFLKKKVYVFTYVSSEKKLYTVDENQLFVPTTFESLFKILSSQTLIEISDIDNLFNPSNYLVSPFNSTTEFIKGEYFLTAHQEKIKTDSVKKIDKNGIAFISICGKAGTGKTLLTFDIAKEYINNKHNVLIIHCGYLNSGHYELRDTHGWDIIPIKEWYSKDLSTYHLVVIDETQRIFPTQLKAIINEVKKNSRNCIFSYDKQQCLRNWETENNITKVIEDETSSTVFNLTEKIRTNKEIASFIISLFDLRKGFGKLNRDNINLNYFENAKDAKKYMRMLGDEDWKIINYTPSQKHTHPYEDFAIIQEDSTHGVIGQEFDKVIAVIDEYFYYKDNKLEVQNYSRTPYYNPTKMLFQIMTRTRKKLAVIVINNPEIMKRCLSILNSI